MMMMMMMMMMMGDFLTMLIFNKNTSNNTVPCSFWLLGWKISLTILSIAVHNYWGECSSWSTPLFGGHILMPWLWLSSGFHLVLAFIVDVNTSFSVQQGYKATFQPVARVPLWLGGSTPCQGGRCQFIHSPDMEGYFPITSHFGLANHDCIPWVAVLVLGFTIWWHLWAATSFPWPNICVPSNVYTHCTLPEVFTHLQWMLWQTSTVEIITSC